MNHLFFQDKFTMREGLIRTLEGQKDFTELKNCVQEKIQANRVKTNDDDGGEEGS